MPAYQDYISKTQLTRVVGELAAAKTAVDAALFEGKIPVIGTTTADDVKNSPIGLAKGADDDKTNPRSNMMKQVELTGFGGTTTGSIKATLGGNANSDIHGATIEQKRDATGVWTCETNKDAATGWKKKFTPSGCTDKTA